MTGSLHTFGSTAVTVAVGPVLAVSVWTLQRTIKNRLTPYVFQQTDRYDNGAVRNTTLRCQRPSACTPI